MINPLTLKKVKLNSRLDGGVELSADIYTNGYMIAHIDDAGDGGAARIAWLSKTHQAKGRKLAADYLARLNDSSISGEHSDEDVSYVSQLSLV